MPNSQKTRSSAGKPTVGDPAQRIAQLEAELRQKNAEFEALFDVIPVGLGIAWDRECKSIRVNRAFAGVLGIKTSQNASKTADAGERPNHFHCFDIEGRPVPDSELPMQVAARDGVEIRDEIVSVVHDDGRVVKLLEYASPLLDEHNVPRGSVGAFVDVTDRLALEERERSHLAELAHAGRLVTMGQMTSELAHELNQPLCTINNYASALCELVHTASKEEMAEWLQRIGVQVNRALAIMRRISDFGRKRETNFEQIDVNETIQNLISLIVNDRAIMRSGAAQASLLTDLTPQRPVAHADRVQIEQVLINLIRNGLEAAMSANRRPEVTVGTSCDGESVQVAVSDNGSGISPQWEEQLFQPFVTDKPQGLGLGLSISRNIVEGHKGRMWVERNNQGGAVFKFTLPLRSSDEASA